MAIDDRTANLNLPKVHADNNPRLEDVPRLRQFADSVDLALNSRPTTAAVDLLIAAALGSAAAYADALAAQRVPLTRTVSAGTGLEGGGGLSGNITLSLSPATIASLEKADTAVQPARTVFAGTGLTGGGDLGSNRTLALSAGSIASLGKADSALQPADRAFASDADAEAGTSQTVVMNPDKTRHMLDTRPPGVPVKIRSSAGGYTIAAADQGYMIYLTTGYSGKVTLPQALAVGHAVTVFNNLATGVIIEPGTSATTLVAGTGATGEVTVEAKGMITAVHAGSNQWIISGVGIA